MEIANGRINIFVGSEGTTIQLFDHDASVCFAKVTLTPQQFSEALARITQIECNIEVFGLDKVGKKMEWQSHEFALPEKLRYSRDVNELAKIAAETCPEGWAINPYFGNQNSLFERDGKPFARCTIRRWI